ncbi:MAG: hypothetical protein IK097_09340, partial [Clostridia bacterium]|nr:hypothetical protein [Clostridia bacterium]
MDCNSNMYKADTLFRNSLYKNAIKIYVNLLKYSSLDLYQARTVLLNLSKSYFALERYNEIIRAYNYCYYKFGENLFCSPHYQLIIKVYNIIGDYEKANKY